MLMIPSFSTNPNPPTFPAAPRCLPALALATLLLRRRSFARDARAALDDLPAPLRVRGAEHIPVRGPCLLLCNHYTRPGLGAWWLVLSITATVAAHRAADADPEMHWVMTSAWTFPGHPWRQRLLTPLTRWAFRRVARVYDFVPMPPMPPDPREVEARARAVRQTLRLARVAARQGGLLGLAPEGQDLGQLGPLPPGAGSFIALLVDAGLPLLPVGVDERDQRLSLSFGPLWTPNVPPRRADRDALVAQQVITAWQSCLAE